MNTGWGVAILFVGLTATAVAQDGPAAPELQPLGRYIGTWQYDGEDKTPVTGGRVSCRSTRRWIAGGYFIESHRTCDTPRGRIDQVEMFGYDYREQRYAYWGFSGRVVSTYVASQIADGRIVWTGLGASAGNRCTEVFAADSQTSSDMCETSTDGGRSWVQRAAGTSKKLP